MKRYFRSHFLALYIRMLLIKIPHRLTFGIEPSFLVTGKLEINASSLSN